MGERRVYAYDRPNIFETTRTIDFGGRAPYAELYGKYSVFSRWTKSFENLFKSFTQLTLRLGLIRGLTSLIRKLDRMSISPGLNPDLHWSYHARANLLGINGYHAASFLMPSARACWALDGFGSRSVALMTCDAPIGQSK